MIETRVIRYQTSSENAEENARLIKLVFSELNEGKVAGIQYEVFRLDDGDTFIHVATLDSERNPLESSHAFAEFQSGLRARLKEGPYPAVATIVGSHGVNWPEETTLDQ